MFIDWLTIYQDFDIDLPVISDRFNLVVDTDSGEAITRTQPSVKHEGSYSTSIQIRVSGSRITVSGNPSRFNRLENLFGLTTIEACVNVYNSILSTYGLPAFTKASRSVFKNTGDLKQNGKTSAASMEVSYNGATITELHITSNVGTGADNARDFVRALSTLPYRHSVPRLHTNGNTVDWLSKTGKASTLIYPSAYIKSSELALHALPKVKRKFGDKSSEFVYLQKVISYCAIHGVVRFEQKLKSRFLRREGLNKYGHVDMGKIEKLHKEFLALPKNLGCQSVSFESVSDRLISKGICANTHAANSTAMYVIKWMHGEQFDLAKSAVKKHRARLRQLGIDIALPCDLTKFALVNVKNKRDIELSSLPRPDWYKAARPNLQLVA